MSLHYPIFLNLHGTGSLVVGGGPVGERKVVGLIESGSNVRLVSLNFTSKLLDLAKTGRIELHSEPYRSEHLSSMKLVFAATNDTSVNQKIAEDAANCHILCNRADAGPEGDFVTPAVVRRGSLCISFTTGNMFPALTRQILRELEERYDPAYSDYIALLGEMRLHIKASTEDLILRKSAAQSLLDSEVQLLALIRAGESSLAMKAAHEIVHLVISHGRIS